MSADDLCCLPARIGKAAIRHEPFPHLVVPEALPTALYAELERSYPALAEVAGPGPLANNRLYKLAAADVMASAHIAPLWREFFAYHTSVDFFRRVCAVWADELARLHPGLRDAFGKPPEAFATVVRQPGKKGNAANFAADVALDCQFGMNSPVTTPSSVRGPHLDNPAKLFAALLYFRHADDRSTGGELELYRVKSGQTPMARGSRVNPGAVAVADHVAYAPNTLVMWLNSPLAIHGVSPRSVTPVPRRYINFLGECYGAGVSFTDPAGLRPCALSADPVGVRLTRAVRMARTLLCFCEAIQYSSRPFDYPAALFPAC